MRTILKAILLMSLCSSATAPAMAINRANHDKKDTNIHEEETNDSTRHQPLTEFYCLLQRALDREGVFALPALYAQFRAPARRIYADEAADFLTLPPDEEAGSARLLAPAQLQLLYSSLHIMPDGAPAALLLTEECTRTVYAVQLLPPFVWEDPLPPLPDAPAALSLTLTMRDVEEIDACPAALGHRLACDKAGKRWLHHPRAETYLSERVALFQRLYR